MQVCGIHNWSGVILGCVIYVLLVGICTYLMFSLRRSLYEREGGGDAANMTSFLTYLLVIYKLRHIRSLI